MKIFFKDNVKSFQHVVLGQLNIYMQKNKIEPYLSHIQKLYLCTQFRPISGEMGREREHLHSLESSGAKFRRHLQKNSPREHPSLFSHSS